MINSLERIKIEGLNGTKNVDIKIKDNTLILVGENGSGKTTILRILFYFLSGSWLLLYQFRFEEIVAIIDGKKYKITRSEVDEYFKILTSPRHLRSFSPIIQFKIKQIVEHSKSDQVFFELQKLSDHYGIDFEFMIKGSEKLERDVGTPFYKFIQGITAMHNAISAQILYLPTYRRIERELSSILEDAIPNDSHLKKERIRQPETDAGYIELVEFGMRDVQRAIDSKLEELKELARVNLTSLTLGYLGDIVDKKYDYVSMDELKNLPEETIRSVLDRIDETILRREHKDRLFKEINLARSKQSDTHTRLISHYFLKLLEFQRFLEIKEKPIRNFCALCSEYTVDKKLVYDHINFRFNIETIDNFGEIKKIELSDLSSGEKQIVSLFSHLYLSGKEKYLILIDEPELSLSVTWQRRFLMDIYGSGFCTGLIAATHSPFIYDNDLYPYAHGLGEFFSI